MAPLVDLDSLRNLQELSPDDPDFLLKIIRTFLQDVPPDLDKMRQCFKNGQAVEMGQVAHGLTSSSQNLGVGPMSQILLELDHMGRSENLVGAEERIERVYKIFDDAKQILEQILAAGKLPST